MPINHVPEEDRYRLTKVRSIPGTALHPLSDCTTDVFCTGFYGVTYRKGFRDKFNVDVEAVLNLICSYILHNCSFVHLHCSHFASGYGDQHRPMRIPGDAR